MGADSGMENVSAFPAIQPVRRRNTVQCPARMQYDSHARTADLSVMKGELAAAIE